MENRRLGSICINFILFLCGTIGMIQTLVELGISSFQYYTLDSNIVCLISCAILCVVQVLVVTGKLEEVPQWTIVLKYFATSVVTVTFIVVITILGPATATEEMPLGQAYKWLLLKGSMFWHHLFCPVVAILSFVFADPHLEEDDLLAFKALIPTFIYGIIVITLNILKLLYGPYPFLHVYEQTVTMSVIWTIIVFATAFIISSLLYVWKQSAQQIPLKPTRMSFIYALAKATYSKIIIRKYGVTLENKLNINLKEGPALLICNHCGAHDPIIVGSVMPRLVRWVAGAYLFKSPLFCLVFKYIAKCIPMQQGQSDLGAIRKMQFALRCQDMVGIFPEGTRTWDGDMVKFETKPLAKMIRMFSVPAVFVNIEGGYAMQPRWADSYRTGGGINVKVRAVLNPDQVKQMSVDEIQDYIEKNFFFSNDQWKKTIDYRFESDKRAEGVQRLLYKCPKCGKIDSITAKGNNIYCKCGYSAEITQKDNLKCCDGKFHTLSKWHEWEAEEIGKENSFTEEKGVLFEKAPLGNAIFKLISTEIKVRLKKNTLVVSYKENGKKKVFNLPFEKISSLILNTKQTIELVMEDTIYRIRLLPDACSLKYHEKFMAFCSEKE